MSTAVRWVVAAVAVVLVVCLLGWARGQAHHRGDEVGSLRSAYAVDDHPAVEGPNRRRAPWLTRRTTAPTEKKRHVPASLGVHDPVRPDRPDGDRDLARSRPAPTTSTRTGARSRAPTTRSRPTPQRILVDSLTAPINGLYGIEDAKGNINYYNSGSLFGAIDVALFIIVIGGFLGVTMRTGAIQAGIGRLVARLKGRERWMIPILMSVFALGGTTYGMAEESLAFYSLVIAVMIAAGYDALTGAAVVLIGCGIGTFGSTINPFATGIASGFAGVSISDGLVLRLIMLIVGLGLGIFFVLRYADRVKADPSRSVVANMREENARHFSVDAGEGEIVMTGRQQVILGGVRAGLPRDDVRRHPLGGPQHRPAHAVVVVPGDDRVVHPVQHRHRHHRPDVRGGPDHRVRRRFARPARASRSSSGSRAASPWS